MSNPKQKLVRELITPLRTHVLSDSQLNDILTLERDWDNRRRKAFLHWIETDEDSPERHEEYPVPAALERLSAHVVRLFSDHRPDESETELNAVYLAQVQQLLEKISSFRQELVKRGATRIAKCFFYSYIVRIAQELAEDSPEVVLNWYLNEASLLTRDHRGIEYQGLDMALPLTETTTRLMCERIETAAPAVRECIIGPSLMAAVLDGRWDRLISLCGHDDYPELFHALDSLCQELYQAGCDDTDRGTVYPKAKGAEALLQAAAIRRRRYDKWCNNAACKYIVLAFARRGYAFRQFLDGLLGRTMCLGDEAQDWEYQLRVFGECIAKAFGDGPERFSEHAWEDWEWAALKRFFVNSDYAQRFSGACPEDAKWVEPALEPFVYFARSDAA